MSNNTFYAELLKRKVVQAAAIYGAVAGRATEILVTVVEQLFLPQWFQLWQWSVSLWDSP